MPYTRYVTMSLFCLLIFTAKVTANDSALPSSCEAPRVLRPIDVERRAEGFAGTADCYQLDLPAAGLLHLNVAVAGRSSARVRLDLFSGDSIFADVQRFVEERMVLADAGTVFVEVATLDPRRLLPAYRLSARFVELGDRMTTVSDPTATTNGEEDDGELEPDPQLATVTGIAARALMPALCRRDDGDDHADTLACATVLRERAAGSLDNGWGDDVDVFRLHTGGWRTVEIAGAGDADLFLELLDAAGQRLAGAKGGEDGNPHLLHTLGPGAWFVRIQGGGGAGAYRLALRALER